MSEERRPDGAAELSGGGTNELSGIIARVLKAGVYISGILLVLAVPLRFLQPAGPVMPASGLLGPEALHTPGDALLWAALFVMGLTPIVALLTIIVSAAVRRQLLDVLLGATIITLFVVSFLFGV